MFVSGSSVDVTVPENESIFRLSQTFSISTSLSRIYLNDSARLLAVFRFEKTVLETVPLVVTTKVALEVYFSS